MKFINIYLNKFSIEFLENFIFKLEGSIDVQDPSIILTPIFEEMHKGILESDLKLVKADFSNLEFLNSSGIKAIAKWIMRLSMLPPNKKYKIVIIQSKKSLWQSANLPALAFLVPGAVDVEYV